MLVLIRQSRCIDIGIPYGWTGSIRSCVRSAIQEKTTDIVSRLEKVIPTVEVKIDKVMEVLNK